MYRPQGNGQRKDDMPRIRPSFSLDAASNAEKPQT
jgi:hypothetical protein